MGKWSYVVMWRMRGQNRQKMFADQDTATAFALNLQKHGLQPTGRRYRINLRVTWLDRIKALFRIGRIEGV